MCPRRRRVRLATLGMLLMSLTTSSLVFEEIRTHWLPHPAARPATFDRRHGPADETTTLTNVVDSFRLMPSTGDACAACAGHGGCAYCRQYSLMPQAGCATTNSRCTAYTLMPSTDERPSATSRGKGQVATTTTSMPLIDTNYAIHRTGATVSPWPDETSGGDVRVRDTSIPHGDETSSPSIVDPTSHSNNKSGQLPAGIVAGVVAAAVAAASLVVFAIAKFRLRQKRELNPPSDLDPPDDRVDLESQTPYGPM
ncbi:Aste57867_22723 [Aphanomyces stellatus]|uniref:Aste57867_22723 protein n=1 Tax=Aphanomyces stellatus TaxID=120398 RepID=A0A485LKZ1_9STRA|nr:hypothetical protein As57867_022653 [Aphanomyces stellatus]VFT99376.1 Aste57867_22723 [Aphanomyces stellatus]